MTHRPIQFRVWAKTEGHYIDAMTPAFGYAMAAYLTGAMDGKEDQADFDSKVVLEQFTCLLDKNGRAIYEGDLVNFTIPGITHGPEREDHTAQQVWFDVSEGCWMFGREFADGLGGPYGYSIAGDRIDTESFEVVGNVHEAKGGAA